MSYHNFNFPEKRPYNSHVASDNDTPSSEYVESQRDLLKEDKDEEIGHVPPAISLISSDNILQQARYHVIAPDFRVMNNLLHAYHHEYGYGPIHRHGHNNGYEYGNAHNLADANFEHRNPYHAEINERISSTNESANKDYDPYVHYLSKRGLLNDHYKTRIYTDYIHVDSRYRNARPSLYKEHETFLSHNPTFLTNNLLSIKVPNALAEKLHEHDRITLTGVMSNTVSIKALYQYTANKTNKTGFAVIFENGRKTLVIKTDYSVSVLFNTLTNTYLQEPSPQTADMSFDPNFSVGDGIQYTTLKEYNTNDMFVELSGFTGTAIGNISTSFLNGKHRIFFTNPDPSGDVYINKPDSPGIVKKITGFYILLPSVFMSSTNPPLNDASLTIEMNFKYIGGIPINHLNANTPITNENAYGFFIVHSVSHGLVSVRLNKDAYYAKSTHLGLKPIRFGGSNVIISKVERIDHAFPNPNDYVIDLPKDMRNIFMIRLVNTVFPNTAKAFRNHINDRLSWQNLDDGDFVYSIQIPEGTYNHDTLEQLLENLMNSVNRVQSNQNGYSNRMSFDVKIDPNTSVVTFSSYKEALLRQPILSVTDANGNIPTQPGNPPYTLIINQPMHNLVVGDTVSFSGFITTLGIPADALNTTHNVISVIDQNTYQIMIDNINLTNEIQDTKGGFTAKVYVPNAFRLLLNDEDTIGRNLGFRYAGRSIAVTRYNTVVTNKDPYQNEIVTVSNGTPYTVSETRELVKLKNNNLRLNGADYILMVVKEFAGQTNAGINRKILEHFAKINLREGNKNLNGVEGEHKQGVLYDTHVHAPILFYDMLNLKQLSIQFYGPDERLFDFGGLNHSFVLEASSLELMPQETGINATNNFI